MSDNRHTHTEREREKNQAEKFHVIKTTVSFP